MNYANLLQGIKADEILKNLNISYKPVGEDELLFLCPNPYHHDTSPSMYLNRNDLLFNCFGCDWQGNVLTLISQVLNIDFDQTLEWLKTFNLFDSKNLLYNKIYRRLHHKELRAEQNPFYIPPLSSVDYSDSRVVDLIQKRHLIPRIMNFYGMKFCEMGFYQERVIIPIMHASKLYGFEARLTRKPKEDEDKCRYPPKSMIKDIIYDLDQLEVGKPLYFCEGLMDCLSLKSRGYMHSSCSFGSKLTRKQIRILSTFREIVLIPDSDVGGDEFAEIFNKAVKGPVIKIITLPEKKDIDELTDVELIEVISS